MKESAQLSKDINIRLSENGGLYLEKIINLFTETLGIFSLADNIYYKQINFITKDDLINYYCFVNKIEKNIWIDFNKNEKDEIDQIINNLKINIENRFNYLFTSSYAGETLEINKKIYDFQKKGKKYFNYNNMRSTNQNILQNFGKNSFLRRRNTLKSAANGEEFLNAETSEISYSYSKFNLNTQYNKILLNENKNKMRMKKN